MIISTMNIFANSLSFVMTHNFEAVIYKSFKAVPIIQTQLHAGFVQNCTDISPKTLNDVYIECLTLHFVKNYEGTKMPILQLAINDTLSLLV